MQALFIRCLRWMRFLRFPATLGAALSYGIIAYGGVNALVGPPLLFGITITAAAAPIIGIAVFFLSVSIESAIFKTSIYEAAERDENAVKRSIARRELKKLLRDYRAKLDPRNPQPENRFLEIYRTRVKYLHDLEENHDKYYYSDKDQEAAEIETDRVRQEIAELEELFFEYLASESPNPVPDISSETDSFIDLHGLPTRDQITNEVINKINCISYVSVPLALFTGISAGLFTAGAILTTITLSPASLIALAVGGGIFAAKGYCLIMYNTVTKMFQNDTLYHWRQEIVEFFKPPQDIYDGLTKLFKLAGIASLTILMVLATIATAGTWWTLAEKAVNAAKKAPHFITHTLKVAQKISGVLMSIPTFFFNITTGLEAGKQIWNKLCDLLIKISKNIFKNNLSHCAHHHEHSHQSDDDHHKDTHWHSQENQFNYWNLVNLCWYLLISFRAAVFIGHVVSSGFTGDQSTVLSAATGDYIEIASEALTDLPFISHGNHSHHNYLSDENEHSHTHDGFLLSEIEYLLKWLCVGWDFLLKWLINFGNYERSTSNKIFYPEARLPQEKPTALSTDLQIHLTTRAIDKQLAVYQEQAASALNTRENKANLNIKISSFKEIRRRLMQQKTDTMEQQTTVLPSSTTIDFDTLSTHRNPLSAVYSIFALRPHKPQSQKIVDRINENKLDIRRTQAV